MRALLHRADLLAGGFLLVFASSLGQTWFIALSGTALRAELALSHGAFGGLYSLATLLSGLALTWLGARVDRVPPRRFALALSVAIGLAALLMAAVTHPLTLLAAFFALRLCGQGLMTHLAMTTLARGFDAARGRALAVAGLGFPVAEASLPVLAVAALAAFGWRLTWVGAGLLVLALLPPLLALLLRRAPSPAVAGLEAGREAAPGRRGILLSARFALLLPTILAPSFTLTAVFFHQGALAAAKGWPAGWVAHAIPVYAACAVASTLLAGLLVDRLGALRLAPLFLLPTVAGMGLLAAAEAPAWALPALGLAGLGSGASNTVITATLAELYGTAGLGTVRALAASASVIASALSPGLVGLALDAGTGVGTVLLACAGLLLAAGPLAARGIKGGPAPAAGRG